MNFRRTLRGWRWRGFLVLAAAAAYWLGDEATFGEGSSVWFPGGPRGVGLFTAMFAFASAVLGVDALGLWERQRARRLLESRLVAPATTVLAMAVPSVVAAMIPAALASFWPALGAWRADYEVAWLPIWAYLGAGALPAVVSGLGAGLAARALVRSDVGALVLAGVALVPALSFRLVAAPVGEIFSLSSGSYGILVPIPTLLREALATGLPGLLFVGAAVLMVPAPRRGTVLASVEPLRTSRIPNIASAWARVRAQSAQWQWATVLPAVALMAVGAGAAGYIAGHPALPAAAINWDEARQPAGLPNGILRAMRIEHRDIVLPAQPGGELVLTLKLRAFAHQGFVALTLGPTLRAVEVSAEGREASIERGMLNADSGIVGVRFDPPVEPGQTVVAKVTARPVPGAERLWERAWHPRFRRFSFLGRWWAEPMEIDFPRERAEIADSDAPFRISAPDAEPLAWVAGSASTRREGGRVIVEQPAADSPVRLVAAELVRVQQKDPEALKVEILAGPKRQKLAESMLRIYAEQFLRIRRAFGQPAQPLVLYEVPEQSATDPMALSAGLLDRLETLLPRYGFFDYDSKYDFHNAFPPINRGLVEEMVLKNFGGFEEPEFLAVAFAEYLDVVALARGGLVDLRKEEQKDYILVPWKIARERAKPYNPGGFMAQPNYPFDVLLPEMADWTGPALERLRGAGARPILRRRLVAIHHMLRGMLGEDRYLAFLQELFQARRGEVMTLDLFRGAAEKAFGEPLGWFFDQWLVEGALPQLRIKEAQAFLFENPDTRALEYRVEVTVHNEGTGRMPVPWVLVTEGDSLEGTEWLGSGEEKKMILRVLDYPKAFELDPDGWIAQVPPFDEKMKRGAHPRVLFKTVTQL